MTRDCLAHIIQLREKGRAEQDQSVLEEARTRLLELVVAYPDDAEVNFQTAVVHDNLGLERESIPFYLRALGQGLSGPDLERCFLAHRIPPAASPRGALPRLRGRQRSAP